MTNFNLDMHIHSCLSPCAEWEMSPIKIIEKCCEKGLDMIAICDHNSAENADALIRVGEKNGIYVLPGMEVCSKEEVHILAIFKNLEQALAMQEYVYAHLPGTNQPDFFGHQVVANEYDEVIKEISNFLMGATTLGINQIVEKTHELGGLSIASHVDRPAYGLINQLGFIPPDLPLDGIEISYRIPLNQAREKIPGIEHLTCVTSSDAHFPDDIGRAWTVAEMNVPAFEEIRLALQMRHGRRIIVL